MYPLELCALPGDPSPTLALHGPGSHAAVSLLDAVGSSSPH